MTGANVPCLKNAGEQPTAMTTQRSLLRMSVNNLLRVLSNFQPKNLTRPASYFIQ